MTDRDQRFAEFERLIEEAEAVPRVVDNRVFLLGLDWLYRSAMQEHERTELRECPRRVADVLGIKAANMPVEGYYAERAELTPPRESPSCSTPGVSSGVASSR